MTHDRQIGKASTLEWREHLQRQTAGNSSISAAFIEGAQMSNFGEHLQHSRSKMIIEHDHLSIFGKGEDFCGLPLGPVAKMLNSPGMCVLSAVSTFKPAGAAT